MSLSEMFFKIIGLVLAFVGFSLLLSSVGLDILGIGLSPLWLEIIVGVIFLGMGIYIARGGNIKL